MRLDKDMGHRLKQGQESGYRHQFGHRHDIGCGHEFGHGHEVGRGGVNLILRLTKATDALGMEAPVILILETCG